MKIVKLFTTTLTISLAFQANAGRVIEFKGQDLDMVRHVINSEIPASRILLATNNVQYKEIKKSQDKRGVWHVRMQQFYAGYPVIGAQYITHNNHGKSLVSGAIYQDLESDLGFVPDNFDKNGSNILAKYQEEYSTGIINKQSVDAIVHIDENNRAHWAYKISFIVSYPDIMPEKPTFIVSADGNEVFARWNDLKSSWSPAKGRGFGGNELSGIYEYGNNLPLLDIQRDQATNKCIMQNKDVRVVDLSYSISPYALPLATKKAVMFNCERDHKLADGSYRTGAKVDGYDVKNGAFSPSNDALYFGLVTMSLYKEWFDLAALVNGSKPMQLEMRVHYGHKYENAFWDGEAMTFGDGGSLFYPLVSLGIVAHEVSHGFTEQHSNLRYYGQSGGMNEAFSDMAAQAAEYFAYGNNSWTIGAEIIKPGAGFKALRYMDEPLRDGYSIDHKNEFEYGMDPHRSSGVYNKMFYLLATYPGWDVRQAFQVMVKANMDYWTPTTNFESGACGIVYAAQDLDYPLDGVETALSRVGLHPENCHNS